MYRTKAATQLKAIALPLLTSLLFAGSFIAGKYTTQDLGPLTTSFLRYVIALVFLTGLTVHYKPAALKVNHRDLLPLSLLGLFGIVGYHYFFFSSLRHTAIANTAIINAFNPVVTSLLAAIVIHERLTFKNYVGGAIALTGVLTLLSNGNLQTLLQLQFNLGDVLMLCAVISWVIYALLIKMLSKTYSGFTITYYAALSGVILLLFLALPEGLLDQVQTISLPSIFSVLYMGTGASGLGYLLYNLSVVNIGPTKTSSFVYSFVPVFVALLALLFFGQPITPIMIASALLIIAGLRLMLMS